MKPEKKTTYYDSGAILYERWYLKDQLHCETGPAEIGYYESGEIHSKKWHLKGQQHRETGPAYIQYHKTGDILIESWMLNDKCHCETGPAWISYHEKEHYEEWWIRGKELNEAEIEELKFNLQFDSDLQEVLDEV